ncbi:SusC/RagA family TonB-linked outer membrane protein [Flammeovirga yaeyamensis]|uniref:SusC/RagA family TonB-linked outer membrane protein n=1 Tax=Flammeovirga yaeyamensis TaxID=367791 RepID=A0AAX1N2Q3_9BACT|nr:SusC/RagA family TonB-linked outer membrane protein [Flammeovirga yaeyamensis]MBB3700898.1 TonB-linked SusC/RagA family outer membrane protein [Flammeovirga yaeyamensis]NMF38006.1 SusC/RagA family TonB-linked outer membrane protein [Flammeovirga yaeyamensis]QWG00656.1 SusC/RagA family TonB-linked outer membrane protein [Flammeovirga yaeyamensis]
MKKHLLLLLSVLLCILSSSYAQDRKVIGTVKDAADNSPLPGVNVLIKGTSNGTVTDLDGNFSLTLTEGQNALVFSFVGYKSMEMDASNASNLNVALEVDAEQLDEVVVTALGIERSERSLSYAASEVKADELGDGSATGNVMNTLSGKVAGVQIAPIGGAGSSSRVVIRGNAVLGRNNQPLYVVDGVPILNETVKDAGNNSDGGDVNTGDGLSSINPDDIESMSVLKGGSATALYGSRAINGVILITTKSGKGGASGIDLSTGASFDFVGITPQDQTRYAMGTLGNEPTNPKAQTSMWGPRITGQRSSAYYDGQERTVSAFDNNYKDFFRTGVTWNTNVSAYRSNENSNVRFSYSNMDNKGMVNNSTYKRNTFNLRGSTTVVKKLKIDGKLTYVNQKALNRMEMGNSVNNYMGMMVALPTTIDHNWLKNYKSANGRPIGYDDKETNPYWTMNEVVNEDELNRVIGMATATYEFTDWIKLMGRTGVDYNSFRQDVLQPLYTPWFEQGRAYQRTNLSMETNSDFLIMFHKQFGDFDVTANAGGAYYRTINKYTDTGSSQFNSPDFQNPGAGSQVFQSYSSTEKAMSSLYAMASIGYKGYLFLDLTARNDWSSTLPLNNNSFFYPSASVSWIFSDMDWTIPDWMSFGKVRANIAQVGSDTDPYQLALQYSLDPWNHNGINIGRIEGNNIPNRTLRPSIQTSYEFGVDLRFFEDRFHLDVAYYSNSSIDQILPVDISKGSGYERAIINAGQIDNKGWEFMFGYKPIMKDNFVWDMTITAAYNQNEVVSLTEGVEFFELLGVNGVSVQAIPGQPYGTIVGSKALRDANGNLVVDDNGRIQKQDGNHEIGNGVQPWMTGFRNTFTYKNISLSILLDGKFGGDIYSSTESSLHSLGKHENTLVGRDEYYANRDQGTGDGWNPGNLVQVDENGVSTPYTKSVDPELYYPSYAGIHEFHMYDASFIKLREISLTYRFSQTLMDQTPFKNISITANAFNVGYLWRNTDNIDPEASFTAGNGQGVEVSNLALPRTFGFKLNMNF